MIPPYTYVAGRLAEERRKDVMREGEHARLMRRARPVRRRAANRFIVSVGDLLVSTGEQLRRRHAPRPTKIADTALDVRQ